ncbi:hypothetical protein [Chryseobacterium sp. FH1]|uniref:hypothetical protein n=1 Tax=Chryseobacterium sp. FH1 TaxID=1233951 RepID=UPI0004E450D1|nr:hypothetical protein [Chryseobacterium sp. FH1]KFC24382.1 hypothetical protein IO90_03535 [Chryseobacterium sp. FH1]
MKSFSFVLILLFLIGCKEENTFADDIVLSFQKDTQMKTQEFNEDGNEGGENLIYIGKIKSNIEVKYYENLLSPPPPPPDKFESEKEYSSRKKSWKIPYNCRQILFSELKNFLFCIQKKMIL